MKIIYTKKGESILVDEEDYEKLNSIKWHVAGGYAISNRKVKGKTSLMHRLIMNVSDRWQLIDHKDRNPLNNQKQNLRICNSSENQKNKKSVGKVKYLGVSINISKVTRKIRNGTIKTYVSKPRFIVHIKIDKKVKHLGIFNNEIDAAKCYDASALKYHGEFANLNFKK